MCSNYCFCLIIYLVLYICNGEEIFQPEQIHLSYGDNMDEMVFSWVTQNSTNVSIVEYGTSIQTFDNKVTGPKEVMFTDGGPEKRSFFLHKVVLNKLKPGSIYYYHVGSPSGWSDVFYFKARVAASDWSPMIAVFGDMGNARALALPYLQEETQKGTIDMALHIGDFAYDMNDDNGRVGDAFMNQIESIAAYIPYMTCVGNHENAYNFSHYRYRFAMPDNGNMEMYYSFDIGPAHIISLSTEGYYYTDYKLTDGKQAILKQHQWLIQDLKKANLAENRATRPWIIVVGHRAMYCSNDQPFCNSPETSLLRIGNPGLGIPGLEDILYQYGVDVQFYAHQHSYERLKPVYNLTVCGGPDSMYVDPEAPVQFISGSGGDNEGQTKFGRKVHEWSGFHTIDYGYTRMKLYNNTHIGFQQVSIDKGGKVIDSVTLVKHKHGAGLYNCHLKSLSKKTVK